MDGYLISISPIVLGVLFGSTIAGVIAYSLNYYFETSKEESTAIIMGYIWILTLGLYANHGHFIVILISTALGMLVFGKSIFKVIIKKRLPKHDIEDEIEIDTE